MAQPMRWLIQGWIRIMQGLANGNPGNPTHDQSVFSRRWVRSASAASARA
jgi:hypothetical protein